MNYYILILLWLVPLMTPAQWMEDFSDMEFLQNPSWMGDLNQFQVDSTGRLQLQGDPLIGEAYLHTPSDIQKNAEWSFRITLLFNPSTSNYTEIDLLAQYPSLPLEERIFLRIGGNSEDRMQLYYSLSGQKQLILESAVDVLDQNEIDLKVEVTRMDSLWVLRTLGPGDSLWTEQGSGVFEDYFPGNLFGWRCSFTSSRREKFYLDNIVVHGDPHMEPPHHRLEEWYAPSRDSLVLRFSHNLSQGVNPILYWNARIVPAGITINDEEMHIKWSIPLEGQSGQLVWSFRDRWSNFIQDSCIIHFQKPSYRQLRFTEIMFDPNPRVDEQFPEFIELYNASGASTQLKGYTVCINQNCTALPDIRIPADHYLILSSDSLPYTLPEGSHFARISLPVLPNNGACLRILNPTPQVVDRMIYDSGFHDDPNKRDGGWSIESAYEHSRCQDRYSWRSSLGSKGASPGWNEDGVENSPSKPIWGFSELLEDGWILQHSNKELFISNKDSLDPTNKYQGPLSKQGIIMSIENGQNWPDIDWFDCAGKPIGAPDLILPDTGSLGKQDVIISEIMFDPAVDHPEFLEIENRSSKPIDLYQLGIAKIDTVFGVLDQLEFLTDDHLLFPAGQLLVLTRDAKEMKRSYTLCDSIFILEANIPTLNNDGTCLAIVKRDLEILETFCYDADWHYAYLEEEKGVSLERLSPSLEATRQDAWHSASDLRKCSPNCSNSQRLHTSVKSTELLTEYDEFSPNNDGFRDVLPIQWKADQYGGQLEVKILDRLGYEVFVLQSWILVGQESIFIWDGSLQNNMIAAHGVYLIVATYRDRFGHQESIVRPCVLRD